MILGFTTSDKTMKAMQVGKFWFFKDFYCFLRVELTKSFEFQLQSMSQSNLILMVFVVYYCLILVMYLPIGRWNIRDKIELGYKDDAFTFRFHILEKFMHYVEQTQQYQFVIVLDLTDCSYRKVAHRESKCSAESLWSVMQEIKFDLNFTYETFSS